MKTVIDSLSDVAKELQGEYEPWEGKFRLKLDGPAPGTEDANRKVIEFRDKNTALLKEKAALEARLKAFDGVDPGEYAVLKERIDELDKKGGVKEPKDVDAKVKKAIEEIAGPMKTEIEKLKTEKAESERRLKVRELEQKLTQIGLKAGVEEKAMPDFISRGKSIFNEDGVAMEGDTPRLSKNKVGEPLPMEEWAQDLQKEAPHLFKSNTGGGAKGSGGVGAGKRTVAYGDALAFGQNAEAIAKGEAVVAAPS